MRRPWMAPAASLLAYVALSVVEPRKTSLDGHPVGRLLVRIGRKGERLSALQHIVNLMLSRRMGEWTRVLVDVEDYRGRR